MTAQSIREQTNQQRDELAIFNNLKAAEQAQNQLQENDLELSEFSIEGDINTYEEVAAMGTVVGTEAGILAGAFLGGTIGVILVAIASTWANGELVNTTFYRFLIAATVVGGGLIGAIVGKRIRANSSVKQRQKGNPGVPRRFRLIATGSAENLTKAKEMLSNTQA